MLFTPWLRSLKFSSRLTRKGHTRRKRRASVPFVAIESLEDRTLLSAPTVISTSPANATHSALVSTNVSATFDQTVDMGTLSDQTFVVHAMQSRRLLSANGDITSLITSGTTVTLNPANDFHPGELVQVTATAGIENAGSEAAVPYVWQFRTKVSGGSGLFADSGQTLGGSNSLRVSLGDLDDDGDLDAFVANFNGQANRVWLNDGNGTFSDSGQSLGSSWSTSVSLGDVDGDGDLDAFVTNLGQVDTNFGKPNRVWLNDGNGTFSDSGQTLGSSDSREVVLGDLDGDGDLDAFVVNASSQSHRVWLNDGSGTFTDSGQTLGTSGTAVSLGDLDGDGDLDAFVVNNVHSHQVWLNDGSGTFSDSGQTFLNDFESQWVSLGDIDADGDLDAFVTNDGANRVWVNDGSGTFSDSGQSLGGSSSRVAALGDMDGDGDLDAFVTNVNSQPNRVWLNDGAGTFTDSGQTLGSSYSSGVALGDLDGDGDLDAFVANERFQPTANTVWLNNSQGPTVTSTSPDHATHSALVSTDVSATFDQTVDIGTLSDQTFVVHAMQSRRLLSANGDITSLITSGATVTLNPANDFHPGELMQVTATAGIENAGSEAVVPHVWQFRTKVNGGSGQTLGGSNSRDVLLADLDGDGDLDAFVANWNGQANRVWLNDGSGTFSDSGQMLGSSWSTSVSLGDVDGDGDLDAFVTNASLDANLNFGQPNRVWLNDGSGTFSDSGQALGSFDSREVGLADLDGDGDLDAFVVNGSQSHRVWLNDGSGTFTDSGQTLGTSGGGLSLGDLDGDGDIDAFVVNDVQSHQVWLNDGSGTFSNSGQTFGGSDSGHVSLGDLDGDGDLDAFVSNDQANRVWLNDGSGTFSDSGQTLGNSHSRVVSLGDLDGDGDLDAFVTNAVTQANRVWLNDGAGTFSDSGQTLGSSYSEGMALGDLDGDGDLDAFVANFNGQPNRVWLNQNILIPVDIDIIPGEFPNEINLKSKGRLSVAVLTTDDFDATSVDPFDLSQIKFGDVRGCKVSAISVKLEDVDQDGDLDLLFHFPIEGMEDFALDAQSTSAELTAFTIDGVPIRGTDSVDILISPQHQHHFAWKPAEVGVFLHDHDGNLTQQQKERVRQAITEWDDVTQLQLFEAPSDVLKGIHVHNDELGEGTLGLADMEFLKRHGFRQFPFRRFPDGHFFHQLVSAIVTINEDKNWYVGEALPVPEGQFDYLTSA